PPDCSESIAGAVIVSGVASVEVQVLNRRLLIPAAEVMLVSTAEPSVIAGRSEASDGAPRLRLAAWVRNRSRRPMPLAMLDVPWRMTPGPENERTAPPLMPLITTWPSPPLVLTLMLGVPPVTLMLS